ncbi:MAG: hypothetical protein L6Q99_13855 [Planctomycetes bacterium]|nr:hypothetical protein [Planctomycetota bacterium]
MIPQVASPSVDVVVLPQRVTPVPRVERERPDEVPDERPAVAPRRDTASFSAEALAKLAAECGDCATA